MADLGTILANAPNLPYEAASSGLGFLASSYSSVAASVANKLTGSPLSFPSDIVTYGPYITFSFSAYQRSSVYASPTLTPQGSSITLPIPNNLIDAMKENWELQPDPLMQAETDMISNAMNAVIGKTGAIVQAGLAGVAAGGGSIGQALGVKYQPFMSLQFNTPELKVHQFQWILAPKTADESNVINSIVNTFKRNMSPDVTAGKLVGGIAGSAISYPAICQPAFASSVRPYLYGFKNCVIDSCTINFAPGSTPSFINSTKAPTFIVLSLVLREMEFWTRSDFAAGV